MIDLNNGVALKKEKLPLIGTLFLISVYFAQGASYKSVAAFYFFTPIFIFFYKDSLFQNLKKNFYVYKFVLFFLFYALVALVWSDNRMLGIKVFTSYCIGFTVFLCLHYLLINFSNTLRVLIVLIFIELIWSSLEMVFGVKWPLSKYSGLCSLFAKHCFSYSGLTDFLIETWKKCPSGFRWNTNNFSCIVVTIFPLVIMHKKLIVGSAFYIFTFIVIAFSSSNLSFLIFSLITLVFFLINSKRTILGIIGTIFVIILLYQFSPVGKFKIERLGNIFWNVNNALESAKSQPALKNNQAANEQIETSTSKQDLRGQGMRYFFKEFLFSKDIIFGIGTGQSFNIFKGNFHNYWLEVIIEFGLIGAILYFALHLQILFGLFRDPHRQYYIASVLAFLFSSISISTIYYFIPQYLYLAFLLSKRKMA